MTASRKDPSGWGGAPRMLHAEIRREDDASSFGVWEFQWSENEHSNGPQKHEVIKSEGEGVKEGVQGGITKSITGQKTSCRLYRPPKARGFPRGQKVRPPFKCRKVLGFNI